MNIMIIAGARPNFVKIAPFIEECGKYEEKIQITLVHTGQHYDEKMSDAFFDNLNIPKPHHDLEVGSGPHGWQTAKIMERLEPLLMQKRPDVVVVFGDVNSTLAAALAAVKLAIPVAHVEAGMRSYRLHMAEEVNRVVTDHVSSFFFCSSEKSAHNLQKEGIVKNVHNVGDIMYDTFKKSKIQSASWRTKSKILEKLRIKPKRYILLTIHRAGNTDVLENLKNILEAVEESGETVVFPVHPRTEKQLKKLKMRDTKLRIIPPVSYFDALLLEKNAKKILTDSGGIQKEAYWLGIPCITLRDETEWEETVESGWNILAGADKKKILSAIRHFAPKSPRPAHFGKGDAAKKIVSILLKEFNDH